MFHNIFPEYRRFQGKLVKLIERMRKLQLTPIIHKTEYIPIQIEELQGNILQTGKPRRYAGELDIFGNCFGLCSQRLAPRQTCRVIVRLLANTNNSMRSAGP